MWHNDQTNSAFVEIIEKFPFIREDVNFTGHYEGMLKIVSGLLEMLPHRIFAPCMLSAFPLIVIFDDAWVENC